VGDGLHIALVAPFSWTQPSAVNQHVADLARALKARGHLPVIVTSSDEPEDGSRTRVLFHRTRGQVVTLLAEYHSGSSPDPLLLPPPGRGPLDPKDAVPVIPVGFSFPVRLNGSVANLGLPVDITSRLEKLMLGADFDLVHVHEPLAPSLSFSALREARSPVVATFHLTPVAVAAYELGQSVLDRFFGHLDGRVVTFPEARHMLDELYAGEYECIPCGSAIQPVDMSVLARAAVSPRFGLYVYRGDSRRSLRAFLRALAEDFPSGLDRIVIAFHRASAERWPPRAVPRRLRSRVDLVRFETADELGPVYQTAAVAILPFLGGEWLCSSIAEAALCGCPVVGPDLPPVRDYLEWPGGPVHVPVEADGREAPARGAVFSPNDFSSVAGAIHAVLRRAAAAAAAPAAAGVLAPSAAGGPRIDAVGPISPSVAPGDSAYSMPAVAERLETLYQQTILATTGDRMAGRTPAATHSLHVRGIGEEPLRRRAKQAALRATRPDWINADLHMHSNFSKDSLNSVEAIIKTAREIGLGAIAVTDHNEIKGALLARELAEGDPFVIVAEEVKSKEGEVIGLFLQEHIPPKLSFDETLSRIKEQGALVYVPHPFDALRTTPSYQAMVDNLHRIDVIEIYNAKVALSSFNLSAERFAAKYNIVAGAGSDAHVLQALGTAMLRMPRFHDPESFMAALWEADIIARRKSLLYLQSLKLLQTTLDRVLPED
jgi:predicted metal-dependent phosphoesterase TrpH/glycosyltransferase involved in cell wall biosynthesis